MKEEKNTHRKLSLRADFVVRQIGSANVTERLPTDTGHVVAPELIYKIFKIPIFESQNS